jgi:hypothetical protein
MSLRADTSDPAIVAAYKDVLNPATETNWYVLCMASDNDDGDGSSGGSITVGWWLLDQQSNLVPWLIG